MTSTLRRCRRWLILAAVLSAATLAAGERGKSPTKPEWEPVKQALDEGRPEALGMIKTITERYPEWAYGFIRYGLLLEEGKQLEAAGSAGARAYELEPTNPAAAGLHMRLANKLGRYEQALAVFNKWGKQRDPGGFIHYYGAEASFAAKRIDAAEQRLGRALDLADNPAPLEFHFLRGRLLEAKGDLQGAIRNFSRGLKDAPEFADHYYNLGVLRRRLAHQGPAGTRKGRLRDALDDLRVTAQHRPDDPDVQMALGLISLDLGMYEDATNLISSAIASFERSGEKEGPRLANLYACLGLSLLRRAEKANDYELYVDAIANLERSESLGRTDRTLYNNLLAAILGAEDTAVPSAKKQWQSKSTRFFPEDRESMVSPLNLIVQYYQRADAALADDPAGARDDALRALWMVEKVVPEELSDEVRNNFNRYVGHIYCLIADCEAALDESGDNQPEGDKRRAQALENGCDYYLMAGNNRDWIAREHFHHRVCQRDAASAFDGGWQYFKWGKFLSLAGLKTMIKYYGPAQAWRRYSHMAVWGALLLLCFVLFVKGFFFPGRMPVDEGRRAKRASSARRKPPTGERKPPTGERKPPTGERKAKPGERKAKPGEREAAAPAPDPDETVAVTSPKAKQRRHAPGLSNRGAVDDVARRLSRQREEQATGNGARRRPPRRRR